MNTEEEFKRIEEVFVKVIAKAIFNGWMPWPDVAPGFQWSFEGGRFAIKGKIWDFQQGKMVDNVIDCSYSDVIFQHDFAKALWRENWKNNLKELVVSDNPVQYLSQFVSEVLSPDIPKIDIPEWIVIKLD